MYKPCAPTGGALANGEDARVAAWETSSERFSEMMLVTIDLLLHDERAAQPCAGSRSSGLKLLRGFKTISLDERRSIVRCRAIYWASSLSP